MIHAYNRKADIASLPSGVSDPEDPFCMMKWIIDGTPMSKTVTTTVAMMLLLTSRCLSENSPAIIRSSLPQTRRPMAVGLFGFSFTIQRAGLPIKACT